jgi:hypothetical protein
MLVGEMSIIGSITWWLEIFVFAFVGGIAIGLGVSWLFVGTVQAEPGALSEWPPILGALEVQENEEK